ncbi:MAG: hypothetical protein SW833_28910 [Cyanobacteriota bacterium]|nr:hypothetical protein [Cyanobacteriota bacterium]
MDSIIVMYINKFCDRRTVILVPLHNLLMGDRDRTPAIEKAPIVGQYRNERQLSALLRILRRGNR